MFDYEQRKMMRVTDIIRCANQEDKEEGINKFVSLSEKDEKSDHKEHLDPDEDILAIETECVSFV